MKEGKVTHISVSYNINAERGENVIGSRIYEARKQHGWSLNTLAEHLKACGIDIGRETELVEGSVSGFGGELAEDAKGLVE